MNGRVLSAGLFLAVIGMSTHVYSQDGVSVSARSQAQNRGTAERRLAIERFDQSDLNMSVRTRKHPEYDPLNVRVGDFVVNPSLTTSVEYDDNVYETDSNEVDDVLFTNNAEIGVKSDFLHHQIDAKFSAEDGRYKDNDTEDYNDYKAYLGGRIDLTDQLQIPLGISYAREHTKRDAPDDRAGIEPTVFDEVSMLSGIRYIGYMYDITYKSLVSKLAYRDNVSDLGSEIYNGDRDRTELSNTLTIGLSENYEVSPFIYVGLKNVDYDDTVDDFGVNRDSNGWDAGIGANIQLSGVTSSTFRVGTVHREFDDPSLEAIESIVYGIDLNWEPSTLMDISLTGQRYVDEAALADTSASINSVIGLGVTYEFAPNLYLYPEVQYLIKDYQSADNRKIERLNSGASFVYKFNQNIWGTLMYQNSAQTEELDASPSTEADSNTVTLSVKLQL